MAPATRRERRWRWHRVLVHRTVRSLLPSFVADGFWPGARQQQQQPMEMQTMPIVQHKPPGRRTTAYLDGLRGIASVIVFVCHYTENCHGYFVPAYGLDESVWGRPSWLQLPYVRVVYAGRPMVHIFFVVSGFALSYRPLALLYGTSSSGRSSSGIDGGGHDSRRRSTTATDAAAQALASAVFRRPLRLFLPCAVSTLLIATLAQTGHLYAADTMWTGQLRSWAGAYARGVVWPWAWDRDLRPGYDIHLWTVPIEFVHSMLLFVVLLGLSHLRPRPRQTIVLALVIFCVACGKWAAAEFLGGLFLAERHVLQMTTTARPAAAAQRPSSSNSSRSSRSSRSSDDVLPAACRGCCGLLGALEHGRVVDCGVRPLDAGLRWLRWRLRAKTAFHSLLLAACLFVAGWPNTDADQTPGIRYLLDKTPQLFLLNGEGEGSLLAQKFWFGIAAVGIVWTCGEAAAVRRWLEGPVAQYCGRISYAVYLVHGPALDYFQDRVLGQAAGSGRTRGGGIPEDGPAPGTDVSATGSGIRGIVGVATPTQRMLTWFVGLLILGPIVGWIADLFWRFVDAPIVKMSHAIEQACAERAKDDDPCQDKQREH